MIENQIIRKKIPLKLKTPAPATGPNTVIRKKLQLKSKVPSTIEQLNRYLDENFHHHLMYIKDSWSEVKHKIRLDSGGRECWWDLELLLLDFAEKLNYSCMSNPSPQWPSNPFNRIPFERSQLILLGKQIKELKIPLNYTVIELFKYLETSRRCYSFTKHFIAYLDQHYRFRLINCKDSQDNYIGYWVKKSEPMTLFERRYHDLTQIAPYEADFNHDRMVEREEYRFYKDILNHMPEETINLESLSTAYFT